MSLKCSLFGHRYGDSEVRRDREQDGTELVETVQEVKRCDRCGEQLVVSESTEVTTVEAADDGDRAADATGESGGTPQGAGTTAPTDSSSNDGAGTGDSPGETATGTAGGGGRDTPGGPGGAGSAGADGLGGPGHEPPEQEMPPTRKDDAVIIDEDGEEQPVTEWPGEDGDDQTDWEPDTELAAGSDTDGRPERPTRSSGGLTVPEGQFYCPECEFSTAVESSSLREGDFCPECHRGALEHHAD
jgi:ssDNA-binding Zn-finger/Zn-ribbon topoisomerase 1